MLSQFLVCCLSFLYVETKLIVQLCWLVADAGKEFKGPQIVLQEKTANCLTLANHFALHMHTRIGSGQYC